VKSREREYLRVPCIQKKQGKVGKARDVGFFDVVIVVLGQSESLKNGDWSACV